MVELTSHLLYRRSDKDRKKLFYDTSIDFITLDMNADKTSQETLSNYMLYY